MRKIGTVCRREVYGYCHSPVAYVATAAFLVLSGYFFFVILAATGLARMDPVFGNIAVILLFVSPILTMRSLAEERRLGTDEFLLTSPLTLTEIVLGKYLALLALLAVMLLLTGAYPLILWRWGDPDWGPIISGYLGIFLLGAAFMAVGLFASSLTENQVISGMVGFGLLLLFWLLSWLAAAATGWMRSLIEAVSLFDRFSGFAVGVIDSSDVLFYLSFIFIFLFLTVRVLEKRRWS